MFDMEDIRAGEKRPVRITFKATGTESLELKIRTRAEGTNVIKETTADKVEVAVKEADLSFKSLGTEETGDLISSDMFRENAIAKFEITANRNYQLEELKNAKVKIKVEGNVEVDGIEKDDEVAFRYYNKACRLDSASGCKHLAYLYYHGIGTKKDKKLSKKELNKACKLGLKEACEIVRDFH